MVGLLLPQKRSKWNANVVLYDGRNLARDVIGMGFPSDLLLTKDLASSSNGVGHFGTQIYIPTDKMIGFGGEYLDNTNDNGIMDNSALPPASETVKSINPDGFSIGTADIVSKTSAFANNFLAIGFRRDPDFFDAVTFLSDGASSQSVAHKLTGAPDLMIVMPVQTSGPLIKYAYHSANGGSPQNNYLKFNKDDASAASSLIWNNTAPTATHFSVGQTLNGTNGIPNSMRCTAYLWKSQPGRAQFGTYTGNGSATGPIITTDHIPGMVWIKRLDTGSSHWVVFDHLRVNPGVENFYAALNDVTQSFSGVGVLLKNNGFQPVSTNANTNANGGTYAYCSWALPQ